MKIRSTVFVSHTVNIQFIALSHESEDSNYKKKLKYIYYDEVTSMNYYMRLNDSEFICNSDTFIDIFDILQRSDKRWWMKSNVCCESSLDDEFNNNLDSDLNNDMRSHIKSIRI